MRDETGNGCISSHPSNIINHLSSLTGEAR